MDQISNNKLTLLRKLNQKKYRQKEQLFLVEGARAVEQIIGNGQLTIEELFFDESQKYWLQERWNQIVKSNTSSIIAEKDFAEISDTDNPQGVLAMCQMPEEIEQEQLAARKGLIIATDAIQDPGNLGTIIRTASWFGVQGLLLGKGTVDHFHPKVVRSTAGATGSIPFIDRDLKELLPLFEGRGWRVVLLDTGAGSSPLRELKTRGKTIIVVGNEANGIDPLLYVNGRKRTRISSPRKTESVESLNAAIATSIALYALV